MGKHRDERKCMETISDEDCGNCGRDFITHNVFSGANLCTNLYNLGWN